MAAIDRTAEAHHERRVLPLPRPPRRPAGVPRGRAQAQGDLLHRDRRLRRGRDEARPDRAAEREDAGRRASPPSRPVLEKVVSNMQEVRARGAHVIAVASEGDLSIGEHAEEVAAHPAHGLDAPADPRGHPAAAAGLPHRAPARAERRSAAQPREDRHGRVAPPRHRPAALYFRGARGEKRAGTMLVHGHEEFLAWHPCPDHGRGRCDRLQPLRSRGAGGGPRDRRARQLRARPPRQPRAGREANGPVTRGRGRHLRPRLVERADCGHRRRLPPGGDPHHAVRRGAAAGARGDGRRHATTCRGGRRGRRPARWSRRRRPRSTASPTSSRPPRHTTRTPTTPSTARPRSSTRACCAASTRCTGSTTSRCGTSTSTARGWTSTASTPRCWSAGWSASPRASRR